jgi:hypothetical protein
MPFKRRYFLLFFILLMKCLHAQEMLGIANSNYAGMMGVELNPASIVGAPYRWEVHILSLDVFAMNNYLFLKKGSKAISSLRTGTSIPPDRVTYKNTTIDKSANVQAFAKAPGFIYSNEKFGIALHAATRVALGARGVPYHLANFMKEGFDFTQQQKINYSGGDAKIAGMNWHELGLTVGMSLINNKSNYLAAGLSLNYLQGLNSFYLLVDNINYNVQSDSLWEIYLAKVEYGHAMADPSAGTGGTALSKKGSGIGGSLGFQFYRNRNPLAYNPCTKEKLKKYDYKIGFSLIDIGRIKFTKAAEKYVFNNVSTNWFGIDTVKIKGVSQTDVTFNNQFFGNPQEGLVANKYSIGLPAAASLQFDYAFSPFWYLNFTAIQRIPFTDYTIRRANQLSLTLRYERKRFELAIPYSFYDYFKHRVGVCLRYRFFVIGTDMIGPYTGKFDAYGLDIYFGIKIQGFGKCKKSSVRTGKRNYQMDCFQELKR